MRFLLSEMLPSTGEERCVHVNPGPNEIAVAAEQELWYLGEEARAALLEEVSFGQQPHRWGLGSSECWCTHTSSVGAWGDLETRTC